MLNCDQWITGVVLYRVTSKHLQKTWNDLPQKAEAIKGLFRTITRVCRRAWIRLKDTLNILYDTNSSLFIDRTSASKQLFNCWSLLASVFPAAFC